MGYGDFKMNAAVGAFLGWKMLPLVILLSSVVGLIFGLAQDALCPRPVGRRPASIRALSSLAGIVALFWAADRRVYLGLH